MAVLRWRDTLSCGFLEWAPAWAGMESNKHETATSHLVRFHAKSDPYRFDSRTGSGLLSGVPPTVNMQT
eukprot:946058-Prorocentrum_minimum.AAC.2